MTLFYVARIASIGILVCTAGFLIFLPLTVRQVYLSETVKGFFQKRWAIRTNRVIRRIEAK